MKDFHVLIDSSSNLLKTTISHGEYKPLVLTPKHSAVKWGPHTWNNLEEVSFVMNVLFTEWGGSPETNIKLVLWLFTRARPGKRRQPVKSVLGEAGLGVERHVSLKLHLSKIWIYEVNYWRNSKSVNITSDESRP